MKERNKFVAYDSVNGEYRTFKSFEGAEEWLQSQMHEEIHEDVISGDNFIAEITHRSKYNIVEDKEDYHEHTEDCPDDCDLEEWPFDSAYDYIGDVIYEKVW